MYKWVGVDGCKGGWLAVSISDQAELGVSIERNIKDLWNTYNESALILIDIPIGLPTGKQERECDLKAREKLRKPRSSSVFPVPCREALSAEDYSEANRLNRDITCRGLLKQVWSIRGKIKEVDTLLDDIKERSTIREIHPEVLFWALAGGKAMRDKKSKPRGFWERLGVLKIHQPATERIVQEFCKTDKFRGQAELDDLLDAMAAAVTAKLGFEQLKTLPDIPPLDAKRLPMEMVYWMPDGRVLGAGTIPTTE